MILAKQSVRCQYIEKHPTMEQLDSLVLCHCSMRNIKMVAKKENLTSPQDVC